MNKRDKRIASFIESLGCEELGIESQSFVLTADLDSIGGANRENCKNQDSDGCTLNAKNCQNTKNCAFTDNMSGCENTGGGNQGSGGGNEGGNTGCN